MANLNYNSNMFYNVHKWDNELSYLGILVSGKLNQYNGQDYKIIDAIDIDWNGAYVKNANAYLYTTEDLINVLDVMSYDINNTSTTLYNNYVTYTYLTNVINENNEAISYQLIEDRNSVIDEVLGKIVTRYDILQEISNLLIDQTKYLEIKYKDIVDNNQLISNRDIYIYDKSTDTYNRATEEYILTHPNDTYYIFLIEEIIDLDKDVTNIFNKLGYVLYDENSAAYSYVGIIGDISQINNNLVTLSDTLDNTTYIANKGYNIANDAYYLAYNAYNNTYYNSYLIGKHSEYNVYKKIKELSENDLNTFISSSNNWIYIYNENDNTYTSIGKYNPSAGIDQYLNNDTDFYVYYNKYNGFGIEKEIEDLDNKINEVSLSANNIAAKSTDEDMISINVSENGPQKLITIDPIISIIDDENGSVSSGLINDNSLLNSFSYLFNWKII